MVTAIDKVLWHVNLLSRVSTMLIVTLPYASDWRKEVMVSSFDVLPLYSLVFNGGGI